ncbi:hypothetical protein PR003_g30236 [Phytophthora rubi]|uniref:Uncharacterized protein n=1 Tax=Phytophthora rubi TaxID=129364 RepID=A0A6A4BE78_9STRA|nr:hypothetical protein PR001_g28541 [Phytophthora rubi]KAE9272333.1 hypothetical protein PR003_g30236 [Phytophthora rubi]
MDLSLFDAWLRQYQAILANDEVNQLRGAQYVYALWGALFAVPVSVLTESEERYSEYGRALMKWWDAAYVTFYTYLPDLDLSTAHSTARYACASKEAGASSGRRTAEVFREGFLVALLCLSLLIHLPLADIPFFGSTAKQAKFGSNLAARRINLLFWIKFWINRFLDQNLDQPFLGSNFGSTLGSN